MPPCFLLVIIFLVSASVPCPFSLLEILSIRWLLQYNFAHLRSEGVCVTFNEDNLRRGISRNTCHATSHASSPILILTHRISSAFGASPVTRLVDNTMCHVKPFMLYLTVKSSKTRGESPHTALSSDRCTRSIKRNWSVGENHDYFFFSNVGMIFQILL